MTLCYLPHLPWVQALINISLMPQCHQHLSRVPSPTHSVIYEGFSEKIQPLSV